MKSKHERKASSFSSVKADDLSNEFKELDKEVEKEELSKEIDIAVEESKYVLVVKNQFGKYKKGDMITDTKAINSIIGTSRESMTVKIHRGR
jgi:hypothetical protein